MPQRSTSTTIRTLDGLRLAGTTTVPDGPADHAVLLVHDAGATREVFAGVAERLADADIASVRFDLPGHGESEGSQEELSLSGMLNVIRAGFDHVRTELDVPSASLVATGFAGGVAAGYSARRPEDVTRLVLHNPLIDYQEHFTDGDYLDEQTGRALLAQGHLKGFLGFKVGRALLNEVFWLQPRGVLGAITAPTLVVHAGQPAPVADGELTCVHKVVQVDDQDLVARLVTDWFLDGAD